MYSDVVLGVEHHHFEDILEDYKDAQGLRARHRSRRPTTGATLVGRYKERVEEERGEPFPQDPHEQLWGAIGAVFGSLDERSAPSPIAACTTFRKAGARRSTCRPWCSAIWATTSATGVAFTRNPSTGEKQLYGEFLVNAQGEDVVAGIRTPQDITEAARKEAGSDKPSLESAMPEAFAELTRIYGALEQHYRDMQDIEFTIEQGKLWMLQTRSGKRTAKAALQDRRRHGRAKG